MSNGPLAAVEGLRKYFPLKGGVWGRVRAYVRAVESVSFTIDHGETFGLVGESGSGKTTVGRTILRLIPATKGRVFFDGTDLFALDRATLRQYRRQMQIIFQDPASSLNSRMTVEAIVGEGLRLHRMVKNRRELRDRVGFLLEQVGLSASHMTRYPHEFSGGQRQRIGIARAISVEPKFIVADEPVSALDVSIQSQILNLLGELQEKFRLSYLFIAHNLAVVENFCDRVAVMYLGRIVEQASSEELYRRPTHPYTQTLLNAVPEPDPHRRKEPKETVGEPPSPVNPPPGCPFHPRCPLREDRCRREDPPLLELSDSPGHFVACWVNWR